MRIVISGEIDIIEDKESVYCCIQFQQSQALEVLCYLEALQLNRLGCLVIRDNRGDAALSLNCGYSIALKSSLNITDKISPAQIELIKCCCIDSYLQLYQRPHIDLEFEKIELSVMIV